MSDDILATPLQLQQEARDVVRRLQGASVVIAANGVALPCIVRGARLRFGSTEDFRVGLYLELASNGAPVYGDTEQQIALRRLKDAITHLREVEARIDNRAVDETETVRDDDLDEAFFAVQTAAELVNAAHE